MPDLIAVRGANGDSVYRNPQWYRYTGDTPAVGADADWLRFFHPDDVALLDEITGSTVAAGGVRQAQVRLRRADGVFHRFLARTFPIAAAGAQERWVVTLTDIDELDLRVPAAGADRDRDSAAMCEDGDPTDRIRLVERLGHAIALAERAGTGVVVMYLDLDHFGSINDTFGRAVGDAVIARAGEQITGVLRAGDTASRFGADEYVLICATSVGARHAVHIAERLAVALDAPIAIGGEFVRVAASIGISLYPNDGDDAEKLIRKADTAMHAAKQSGRNTYRIFGESIHEATVGAIAFEADLREAIEVNQFDVHYQPIVNMTSGLVLGAEALVRWRHPRRGLLPPGQFIPLAERANLIGQIGHIVLHAACAQLNRFKLADDDPFAIAVNVSAAQFFTAGFVDTIAAALERYAVGARRLELEITESIMMGNGPVIIDTVKRLKALGVRLSIDDFGTGYSSLAYLRDFPIDTLKIDRSFVTGITTNRTQEAISAAIVTLAHSMGIHVIGEGVETQEQLDALRSLGSDSLQGNFISRPLPAAEFESFVATYDSGVFPELRFHRLAPATPGS